MGQDFKPEKDRLMFERIVFDLETNGLLDTVTKVHCMVIQCLDTGTVRRFVGVTLPPSEARDIHGTIEDGLGLLREAQLLVAHNGIGYDLPVLRKLYGFVPKGLVRDTLILTRLIYSDVKEMDFARGSQVPGKLIGSHKLEAWGYRIGILKGTYGKQQDAWDAFSLPMLDYCTQDVNVTFHLWHHLKVDEYAQEAVNLEHQVATIIQRQVERGFAFDHQKAIALLAKLTARREELTTQLREIFPPWEVVTGTLIPKRDNKTRGYKAGVPVKKTKMVEFNPASHDHIASRLRERYGWVPSKMTETGKPAVDDEVLVALDYPEAKLLSEFMMINKRLGQLSEGNQAWLKKVFNGRIHGGVVTNGAVTGRMTHNNPNLAQVPAGRSPYGHECRDLFKASEGYYLIGCDADALELRDLAGYMANWDEGAYVKTVLEGKKEDGTDMHTINQKALGLDSRDTAKTWFYAYIYGAGDGKLGAIVAGTSDKGKVLRHRFQKNLPALGKLADAVRAKVRTRGYLIGLDGRKLKIRSEHAALNTLLQSAGAIQMKKALCILDEDLQAEGYKPGIDYEFVANVHDEWQIEIAQKHVTSKEVKFTAMVDGKPAEKTKTVYESVVGEMAADSIRKAGEYFKFGCPLKGNYEIGRTWADTH